MINNVYLLKLVKRFLVLLIMLQSSSCFIVTSTDVTNNTQQPSNIIIEDTELENFTILHQEDPIMLRTPHNANELDLETPLRCNVNWQTQEMVQILPHNNISFRIEMTDVNDDLPKFEVRDFSFENIPSEQALLKITKEAGVILVAKDGPYPSLYGKNINGSFDEVVKMIAQSADVFYRYDKQMNSIILSRKNNFTLYAPHSRTLLIGFLDILRGAGITDMVTNWIDYSISFESDLETMNKINDLIVELEKNPTMVMYDVSIFKVIPNEECGVLWKDLLNEFKFGSIATTQTGVLGRILTVTNDISYENVREFISKYASIQDISEGRFVVPTRWFSRFDVGRCGLLENAEYPLSVLAKANIERNNKITSDITLDTTNGEITKFNVRGQLGENYLIIGLPSDIFGSSIEGSETVVYIVPRLVKMLKTDEKIKNKI